MLVSKQKYYFFLLVFLLLPFSLQAAWSEPSQVPPGGNVPVPIYSTGGLDQTIDGTLHVGTPGSYVIGLQGTGSDTGVAGTGVINGIQGNSPANALFGNLSTGGTIGSAVYGLAVDANDYALFASGGIGIGLASGEVWFKQRNTGVSFPHINTVAYGNVGALKVMNNGETQIRSLGGGINFMKVTGASPGTLTSLMTISEAGAANVVTGPLTVGGTAVCLSTGAGCPAPPAQAQQYWAPNGSDIYSTNGGAVELQHSLKFNSYNSAQNIIDFDPLQGSLGNYLLIRSGAGPSYGERGHLRINRTGETLIGGPVFIGHASGVLSMDPVTNPTNVNWAVRINPAKIEALGGGDIDLKSGTLSAGYASLQNDLFLKNGKSIQVTDNAGNTSIQIGNYAESATFAYGSGKTASLAVEGDVKGNRLCFGDTDCQSNWAGIVQGGGGAYWTLNNPNLYPNQTSYNVGIGTASPGAYKLNVNGNMALQGQTFDATDAAEFYLNANGNVQIHIDANKNGANSFKINNGANDTVFTVNEAGDLAAVGNFAVKGNAAFGNFAVDPARALTTPTLYAEQVEVWKAGDPGGGLMGKGTINAQQLCIQGVCRAAWPAAVAAGWTDGGTNVRLTDIADNVGIGVSSPGAKLQVNAPVGTEGIRIVSAENWSPLNIRNYTNTADIFRVAQDGSVAIGDNTNAGNLTIQKGILYIQNPVYNTTLNVQTRDSYTEFNSYNPSTSGAKNYVFNGGNVGIGKQPSYKLDVNGAINGTQLCISGTCQSSWAAASGGWTRSGINVSLTNINDVVGIGTASPDYRFHVEGPGDVYAAYINGNIGVSQNIMAVQNINAGAGIAAGGYAASPNRKVTTPTLYAEQVEVWKAGDPGGGLKGAGTINAQQLCISGNCKGTGWGPNSGAYGTDGVVNAPSAVREYKQLPAMNGLDYFCSAGFVIIGIRNSNPAQLICGRMW